MRRCTRRIRVLVLYRLKSRPSRLESTAQAAPGGEQADGLQQVGLARPVRPDQEHRPPIQHQLRPLVGAEVGQGQAREASPNEGWGSHRRVIAGFAGFRESPSPGPPAC